MKITGILNKRLTPPEKVQKICGIVYSVLFGGALALFGAFFLKMSPVVACLLLVIIAAPLIVLRLYRVPSGNTVMLHLLCIAAGVYAGFLINELCANETDTVRIVSAISAGVVFCFFAELAAGFVMNFSGGEDHPEMFGKALLFSFPLYFTIFLYVPSETFFNNALEFKFIYFDFAPYLLIKTVLFTFVTAVLLCAFDERGFGGLTRLLCGLTLGVYAQYMFMNGVLPTALGEHADWDALTGECIVNAVIWLAIIALPFIAGIVIKHIKPISGNEHAKNAHNYVSVFLGGVQLITLVTLILTAERGVASYSIVSLSNEEQFTVSRNRNIITIIIDMADRDFFDDAQVTHPEKFECLNDFTYYTNACMMYDSTYFSIPQMLTASEIIPEDTQNNWLDKVWGSESAELIYKRLHDNNYRVNVFGDFAFGYDQLRGKVDNNTIVTSDDIVIDRQLLYRAVDTISAYRWMPLGLKYNYEPGAFQGNDAVTVPNACIIDNREFLSKLDLKLSDSEENYFVVEHIIGTHGFTDTYDVETLDCLDILDRYISELKRLGIYDDALIIVTGDHGKHHKPDGVPIWYMKLPGETDSMLRRTSAPIYHTDFAATCLDAVGLLQPEDRELLGRPVYEIGEDENRTRLVFQRSEFKYVGTLDWKNPLHPDIVHALYGYWFTGDRADLKAREEAAPPDIFLEIDGTF